MTEEEGMGLQRGHAIVGERGETASESTQSVLSFGHLTLLGGLPLLLPLLSFPCVFLGPSLGSNVPWLLTHCMSGGHSRVTESLSAGDFFSISRSTVVR